jgi:aspartyl protease family protein
MSGYQEQHVPSSGLVGHSLRLAGAVLVAGLAVVLFIGREDAVPPPQAEPAAPAAQAPRTGKPLSELVLKAGPHGHFTVDAVVNGNTVTFLVDTGASAIYLTPDDARRLGWPPQRLTFSERYYSAGGELRAAPVTLRSLRIGALELYDLPASVGERPGTMSLLGMTFLKRLDSYQVRGDTLILAW